MHRHIYLITAFMLFFCSSISFADVYPRQFFGTHVFIELPETYEYQTAGSFGFLKSDRSVAFVGARIAASLSSVEPQFRNSSSIQEILPKTKRVVYKTETKNSRFTSIQYALLIGNDSESAVIGATILNPTDVQRSQEEILKLLDTATWNAESDLNFAGAEFFEPISTFELSPTLIVGNRIVYTVGGSTIVHAPFQLYIGKNFVSPRWKTEFDQFEVQFLSSEAEGAKVLSQERTDIFIDGMRGFRYSISYMANGKVSKKLVSILFDTTFIYFIGEVSTSRDFDIYFENYDTILNSFRRK